jgi:hypothetical protein
MASERWRRPIGVSLILILLVLCLAACDAPQVRRVVPHTASSFGHTQVTVYGDNFLVPGLRIWAGGVPMIIDRVVDDHIVRATLQGSPEPGPVDVVVSTSAGEARLEAGDPNGLRYEPPVDPYLFENMVAIGASFSWGIQSNTGIGGYRVDMPSGTAEFIGGQLMCPSAIIARHAGAFCPQPLTLRDGFPGLLEAEDVALAGAVDPDPEGSGAMGEYFVHPWTGGLIWKREGEVFNPADDLPDITSFADVENILRNLLVNWITNHMDPPNLIAMLRIAPTTETHNFSIPGMQMVGILHGAPSGLSVFGWLGIDPAKNLFEALTVSKSSVRHCTEIDPSLIVSVDLYGNSCLFSHPRHDVFKSHLLLLLLDLVMSEWLVDPTHPAGAPGIPYVDIEPAEGPISHADEDIVWSPFVIDWEAIEDPALRDLLQQALAWMEENLPDFGPWSVGWEVDKSLVADFTRIRLPDGTPMATMEDDLNGDGWVDADELLPHVPRILASDPDPDDNPQAILLLEIWNMMIFASGEGSEDDRDTAIRFNGYLYEIAEAINPLMDDVIIIAPSYEMGQRFVNEDPDCGGPIELSDLDGDGDADVWLRMFGGFFSLDGLHPANLGYATLSNQMITALNERFYGGEEVVPLVDLFDVWQQDYLRAQLFDDDVAAWAEEQYEAPCDGLL